jgi:hypothetical protein
VQIKPDDAAVLFNIWDSTITEYPETPGSQLIIGGTTWGTATGKGKEVVKDVAKRTFKWVGSAVARANALV